MSNRRTHSTFIPEVSVRSFVSWAVDTFILNVSIQNKL